MTIEEKVKRQLIKDKDKIAIALLIASLPLKGLTVTDDQITLIEAIKTVTDKS